jgi:hypothetical protein
VKFLDPNFVNHATQEEIFPKVVVGDAKFVFLYPNIPCGVFQIKQ